MPTIARYNAQLSSSANGFDGAFNKSAIAIEKFQGRVSAAGTAIKTAAAGIAVGLAAIGVAKGLSSAVDRLDALDEASIRTGVSVEALSRLQYAASFSSVAPDQLTEGIGKMQRSIVSATGAADQSKTPFAQLGLSAASLVNQSPDVALGLIADRIMALPTPAERAAAAMSIFGKSGASLLPFLAAGSAGIATMSAEADQLGITVSAVDAAEVAKAADAMGRVSAATEGVANRVAIAAAPAIQEFADDFLRLRADGSSAAKDIGDGIAWVVKWGGKLLRVIYFVEASAKAVSHIIFASLTRSVKALDAIGKGLAWIVNLAPGVDVEFTALDGTIQGLSQETQNLRDQTQIAADKMFGVSAAGDQAGKTAGAGVNDIARQAKIAAGSAAGLDEELDGISGPSTKAVDAVKKLREEIEKASAPSASGPTGTLEEILRVRTELNKLDAMPEEDVARAKEYAAALRSAKPPTGELLGQRVSRLSQIDTADVAAQSAASDLAQLNDLRLQLGKAQLEHARTSAASPLGADPTAKYAAEIAGIERITELQRQLNTERGLGAMNELSTPNDADAQKIRDLTIQIDQAKKLRQAQEDSERAASAYRDATKTDSERHTEEIARINDLRVQGYLDAQTAARAVTQADQQFQEQLAQQEKQSQVRTPKAITPQLLEAGSSQANAFAAAARAGDKSKDLVPLQARANRTLERIANAVEDSRGPSIQTQFIDV